MLNWWKNVMRGRYGMDHFGRFLSFASLALLLLAMLLGGLANTVLWLVAVAVLVYSYFRMFSRNTSKRYAENMIYFKYRNKVTGWFGRKKARFDQRKTYSFFRCPQCGVTARVPKGKGKIKITCPKCANVFVRKS